MTTTDRSLFRRGLRYVVGYARAEPLVLTAAFLGAALFAAMAVGATVALGILVDDVVIPLVEGRADRSRAIEVLALVGIIAIARAVGVVARRFLAGMLQARTKAHLQHRALERLLAAPLRFVRTTPTGRLLAHVDSDADAATEPLAPLPFSIGAAVLIVMAVLSLFLIDPWLGLVGVVLVPLLLLLQRAHGRYIEKPALEVRQRLGTVASIAHESFDGALVVKTLGREADEQERFEAAAAAHRDARVRVSVVRAVYDEALESLPNLGVVALVLVATWRVDAGAITIGQLVQSVAVFGILAFPIAVAGYFFASLPIGTIARERLEEVFDLRSDPLLADQSVERLPDGHLGVALHDLRVAADDTVVLHGVSLTVGPGETVALVGSTGSGKSTILRALARLVDVESGRVEVGGVALDAIDETSLRSRVGFALQESFMFGDTIERNLRLGVTMADAAQAELDQALQVAAADFVADLDAGTDTVVGERGVTLSGGQRQRVALARAMLRRPGLLLLDDATSAIDPVIEQRILEQLRQIETTVVVVAHRMSTIALADRVVFLSHGRVAGVGSHGDLLADPGYAALVQAYEAESVA